MAMSDWKRIASKSDLPGEGEAKEFSLGEKMVCVANIDGEYAAMDNVCVHRGPHPPQVPYETEIVTGTRPRNVRAHVENEREAPGER